MTPPGGPEFWAQKRHPKIRCSDFGRKTEIRPNFRLDLSMFRTGFFDFAFLTKKRKKRHFGEMENDPPRGGVGGPPSPPRGAQIRAPPPPGPPRGAPGGSNSTPPPDPPWWSATLPSGLVRRCRSPDPEVNLTQADDWKSKKASNKNENQKLNEKRYKKEKIEN